MKTAEAKSAHVCHGPARNRRSLYDQVAELEVLIDHREALR